MSRVEHYICDHCQKHFQPNTIEGVSAVNCSVGGNGAAADTFYGDLCRDCYSELHTAIRAMFNMKVLDGPTN